MGRVEFTLEQGRGGAGSGGFWQGSELGKKPHHRPPQLRLSVAVIGLLPAPRGSCMHEPTLCSCRAGSLATPSPRLLCDFPNVIAKECAPPPRPPQLTLFHTTKTDPHTHHRPATTQAMERATEEVFETPDVHLGEDSTAAAAPAHSLADSDPENLVPTPLNPDAAFEVFHGKTYETSSLTNLSGSIAPGPRPGMQPQQQQQRRYASDEGGEAAAPLSLETPVQRYLRLKAETSDLADEMEALVAAQQEEEQQRQQQQQQQQQTGGQERGAGAASFLKHLAHEVSTLKGDLLTLVKGPGRAARLLSRAADTNEDDGQDISSIAAVQAETDLAEALVRKVSELTTTTSTVPSTAKEPTFPRTEGGGGGNVVYELYYDGGGSGQATAHTTQRRASSTPQLQALEGRLAALEKMLVRSDSEEGGGEGPGATSGLVLAARTLPLVEALAKVERQATLLDAGAIETLRQRLVLLKTEWDDFKKERLKLANSLERDTGAHYRRVEALHEQLQRLAPVSADLPQLVDRLRVLQDLHGQSLRFGQRLEELEGGQSALRQLLQGAAQSLEEVKWSLKENMVQVEANVRDVDARLEGLRMDGGQVMDN